VGSPTGRESYGDGGLVVVAGVTPGQGGRERRPQGEGGQVIGPSNNPGGMRNACDMRFQCAARRSLPKEVQDLLAWSSQRLGRSWAQSDPGDAGEGGKRR
jgi:hypothetical protein